jgi:hypothetical protein
LALPFTTITPAKVDLVGYLPRNFDKTAANLIPPAEENGAAAE